MGNSQLKRETANTSAVLTPASFKLKEHSKTKRDVYLQTVNLLALEFYI
jgi:hypothetical protein